MIRVPKTAQEFIQSSFSPVVAVLCGSKVDSIVSKNHLSFVELLQPFTTLDWEVGQIRDPAGSQCIVKNWKLIVRDVHWKPPQPTEARKQLNNAVILNYTDQTVCIDIRTHKFDIPQSTPWFDAWRETYFQVQFPSDHEFTKHFVGCILVATTWDDNALDTYNSLLQQLTILQNITPPKLPKWFNSSILKTYVLLHDVATGSKEKAETLFEQVKQIYGTNNCFLLNINSKGAGESDEDHVTLDPWAPFINRSSDNGNETASAHSSLPRTPVDVRSASSPPSNATAAVPDESPTFATVVVQSEGLHPLSPVEDSDLFDNANSLQNHTFSGSTESVSVNTNISESYPINSTALHGTALNKVDIEALKQFIKDYASKALLPYFEKQISLMYEVVANRKGVSRSLLSATKRWFGSNKPGTNTSPNTVIYAGESAELQLRRLGDLWFMCGQWQRAFDAYHTAKREFNADGAWLCYAGALEMAAISAFMAGEPTRKTYAYMEESILTYLNTCRMVQYAVRATLLSVVCLGSAGLHGEAAKQLIRMTSEDSDLRSAMLLEQASLCFLAGPPTRAMPRKYAFHMVLAGHRFSKAAQKKHAYRCYKQAHQVYGDSGWRLASEHVQFALGRLAGGLRQPREAIAWLAAPLAPHSPQPAPQQLALLREYMHAHTQWVESCEEFKQCLPPLVLPLIASDATAVLCVGSAPLSSPGRCPATSISLRDAEAPSLLGDKHWHKMEEMLLQVAQRSQPMIFKPTVNLHMSTTDNSSNPVVPQGEPVQVSILLQNPLKISLTLKDLELLWQFEPSGESKVFSNEASIAAGATLDCNVVSCQKTKSLILDGETEKHLNFTITPLQMGELRLLGLAYKLTSTKTYEESGNGTAVSGKQYLEIKSQSKSAKLQASTDKRLQITVTSCAPCLQMTFSEINSDLLSGEIQKVDVEFRNVGPIDMQNLYIAVSHPECLCLVTSETETEDFQNLYEEKYKQNPSHAEERTMRQAIWRATCSRHVRLVSSDLAGGGSTRASLLLRPTARAHPLRLLAYYEAGSPPYRLLRHTFTFNVIDAVRIVAIPRRNITLNQDNKLALEKMNLAAEIKNVSKSKDTQVAVEILETSLLSRQWKFTESVRATNCNTTLSSHEKLHVILRGMRIKDKLPEGKIEWSSLKILKSSPDTQANINMPPYSKFVVDYQSPFDGELENISQNNVKNASGLIQSMLVLRWKAYIKYLDNTRTAIGQHYVWLDCFFNSPPTREGGTTNIDIPSLKFVQQDNNSDAIACNDENNKGGTVMFRMEHLHYVDHDFNEKKLCLVPVIMHVVNCYGVSVKASIDMLKRDSNDVGWAGALSSALECGVSVSLGPFEARRVHLRAVCAAPGTYLLGAGFIVTCYVDTRPQPIVQHVTNSSLLVVKHT